MTKSTITREWLQQTIAELESVRDEIPFGIDTNSELELAAFKLALAAMGSEPVAWTDEEELRDANESGSGYLFGIERDANKFADPRRQIMLYLHAQLAPGKPVGVINGAREPVLYGEHIGIAIGTHLYAEPQPVPVVPDEVTSEYCPALVKYDVTEVDEAWARGFNACRAAMLQAEPVTTANKLGNSPVIPGKWIPVSEQMPIPGVDVLVAKEFFGPGDWRRKVGHVRHEDSGWNIYGASWAPTHWMPLPAAPQEVKP